MRIRALCMLAAVGMGCSIPPTRLGREASNLDAALSSLESAKLKDDKAAVAKQMRRVEELARALAAKAFIGDPRRALADKAAARVRELRREAEARKSLSSGTILDSAEIEAEAALGRVANAKATVKGPPTDLDLSVLAMDLTAKKPQEPEQKGPSADADFDRPWLRKRGGDKEGDVSDEPPKEEVKKPEAQEAAESTQLTFDRTSRPVTILPPVAKDRGVIVYFYFYNKGDHTWIGSVTGQFRGDRRGAKVPVLVTYEADGFEPNWKNIFESKGKTVTMNTTPVGAGQAVKLVAVTESQGLGKVTEVSVEVTIRSGQLFTGIWKSE